MSSSQFDHKLSGPSLAFQPLYQQVAEYIKQLIVERRWQPGEMLPSEFKLADEFNKSQWGFAVLGVVIYYAGTIISGILIALSLEIFGSINLDDTNDLLLGLAGIPFGLLACWGLYTILKRNWSRPKNHRYDPEILDAEVIHKDY